METDFCLFLAKRAQKNVDRALSSTEMYRLLLNSGLTYEQIESTANIYDRGMSVEKNLAKPLDS